MTISGNAFSGFVTAAVQTVLLLETPWEAVLLLWEQRAMADDAFVPQDAAEAQAAAEVIEALEAMMEEHADGVGLHGEEEEASPLLADSD